MKSLRLLLLIANAAAVVVLLAIPVGRLGGMIEQEVGVAGVFGWLIYFVPLLASALALWGVHFSRPRMIRLFVVIAMPGSFLMAFVSIYTYLEAPSAFAWIGGWAAILLGLNVLALWEPFRKHLESTVNRTP